MQKSFISAINAAVVLTLFLSSCTKTELRSTEQRSLVFKAYSLPVTKGYVSGSPLYEKDVIELHDDGQPATPRDIYMSAYIYPQAGGEAHTYFVGEKFTYNNESTYWSHDPVYSWPFEACMDFLAVTSSAPFADGDIEWRTVNGADQVRLVVRDSRTQDDVLYASGYHVSNNDSNGDAVPLLFRHAQAWLELQMSVVGENMEGFRIKSVTLEDVYTYGELTVTNSDGQARALWDFRRAERKDTPFDDPYDVIGRAFGSNILYMDMLLPEQEQKNIVIKYVFSEGGEEHEVSIELPHSYWLQGSKYIYRIDFEPQVSTFSAEMVDWDGYTGTATGNGFLSGADGMRR